MPANSYGIIVEGEYDSVVYEAIIRNLASHDVHVKARDCGGRANLMQKFPRLLKFFEYAVSPPVDMVIVIQDADGRDADELEQKMQSKIAGRPPFPVHCCAVRQAMEAWLLADAEAIRIVAERRSKKGAVKSQRDPEELPNPKQALRELLEGNKIPYTARVGAEIAHEMNAQVVSNKCPRFRVFSELVDC
jgi:hypothetical protein